MSKSEKPRELGVSLHFSPFAPVKVSQKRLECIRADVLTLQARDQNGVYE